MSLPKQVNQLTAFHGLAQPSDYCCAKCETQATEIVRHQGKYYSICDTHHGIFASVMSNYDSLKCMLPDVMDNPIPEDKKPIPSKRYCWTCFLNRKNVRPTTEIDYFGLDIPACEQCVEEHSVVYAYCWGIEREPWDKFIMDAYMESIKREHLQ